MPDLLDVQLRSFEKLIEQEDDPEKKWDFSLDRVFGEIFPISDANENFTLEYVAATLGEPEVLGGGVHRARHDLRGTPQGRPPPHRVGGAGGRREAPEGHHREGSLPG
jgi:DNA-directed RNA polymerase beta subunit